jgi:hypothetical protein
LVFIESNVIIDDLSFNKKSEILAEENVPHPIKKQTAIDKFNV